LANTKEEAAMGQKIREVMTAIPVTLERNQSLVDGARMMRDGAIGDVLVTDNGRLTGVLTDRDIVVRCVAEARDPGNTTVGDCCSSDPVTVTPEDDVDKAVQLMRERAVRRIPVVEGRQAVGVVSIGDLALAHDEGSALADISAAPPND
jgi:CBS domain-containing protein